MSKYLTRDDILAAPAFLTDEIEAWGGLVRYRELTTAEVESIGLGMATPGGKVDARKARGMMAKVVSWACIDQNDERLFTKDDVKKLGRMGFSQVYAVAAAILKLSGLEEEAEELAEAAGQGEDQDQEDDWDDDPNA